jgi:hypothetical protein
MKRGPASVARLLPSRIDISAAPTHVARWCAKIVLECGWYAAEPEAYEIAESWSPRILSLLRQELDELNRVGRFCSYAFNSSSSDLVQGSAFIEPGDHDEVKIAKAKRVHFGSYFSALRDLTPREFELLCAGVMQVLGVQKPVTTPHSADEGLDFYGRLNLSKQVSPGALFPGLQNQLDVWMIGQAKRYIDSNVSTPDIRDLVGAVTLARAHAFGSSIPKYADLAIRVCDPVFFLFFTTGRLSANAWDLLDRSGVVAMDGEMLAAFLADRGIGLNENKFDQPTFMGWLGQFG